MSDYLKKQIQERMEAKHLNAYALEKAAGLNRSTVRNILQGASRNPNLDVLKALTVALDCTLEDLVGPVLPDEKPQPLRTARKTKAKLQDSQQWNKQLYAEAVAVVSQLAEEQTSYFTFTHMTRFIHEAYQYALSKHADTIEKDFCRWLMYRSSRETY